MNLEWIRVFKGEWKQYSANEPRIFKHGKNEFSLHCFGIGGSFNKIGTFNSLNEAKKHPIPTI